MTWDPDGIVVGEAFRSYVEDLRETHNCASGGGNAHFSDDMNDTTSDKNVQTYDDSYLEAAHYASPDAVAWTWLVADGGTSSLDTQMTRRGAMVAGGALFATAMTAGTAAAQGELTINRDSEFAHTPTAVGTVTVAEHRPEFPHFGYIADDDSETTLEAASLAEREDEDTPHNPVRIRADNVFFSDRRAFPRDLTTTNADEEEEDGSALDAEFWTVDDAGTAGTVTVEDASDDRLRVMTDGQAAGDVAVATFDDFTIDSGEQRRVLQLIANIDQLGADTAVDVEIVDTAGDSVVATIDAAADSANDATIATEQGQGVIYQQQLGELPDGELLDTLEEVVITVSDGDADLTFHGLNVESSSHWGFGERESLDEDEDVETNTVREQAGYFGITDLSTLYDSERLSDATIYDVEYPYAEFEPTEISLELEDGERYEYEHRLRAVHNFELPSAYDLEIELSEWVDEVAHPSGRYLAMETATGLDDVVGVDETDDVEWTARTSSYSDNSIGDSVELPSTVDAGSVFALSEDVLLRGDEADEVVVESAAAMGPTGRSSGGILSRIFSIPGAIAGSVAGLGIIRYFRSGA